MLALPTLCSYGDSIPAKNGNDFLINTYGNAIGISKESVNAQTVNTRLTHDSVQVYIYLSSPPLDHASLNHPYLDCLVPRSTDNSGVIKLNARNACSNVCMEHLDGNKCLYICVVRAIMYNNHNKTL